MTAASVVATASMGGSRGGTTDPANGVRDGATGAVPVVAASAAEEAAKANTTLQAAARIGDMQGAKAALQLGARLNAKDAWGLTPLHSATLAGHVDMVVLLLDCEADINSPNERGQTALHLVIVNGHDALLPTLLSRRADPTAVTAHGSTALELAERQATPNGYSAVCIREELANRLAAADAEEQALQQRLEAAVASRVLIEAQLGPAARHAQRATSPSESEELHRSAIAAANPGRPERQQLHHASSLLLAPGNSPGKSESQEVGPAWEYWQALHTAVTEAHAKGQQALLRARLREQPVPTDMDNFSWEGKPPQVLRSSLAMADPDDPDLVGAQLWLREVAEATNRRQAALRKRGTGTQQEIPPEDEATQAVRELEDEKMRARTGRTQSEWETFVRDLRKNGGHWDWAKLEIRQRLGEVDGPGLRMASVYAMRGEPEEVAFEKDEVIGPLGGVLRRRVRYEQLYYKGHDWALHDPLSYHLTLRVQTADMKVEPLVLDLRAGGRQNQLQYLSDVRSDPLGLRLLLKHLDEGPTPVEPTQAILPARSKMPRPRSRPGSPTAMAQEEVATPVRRVTPQKMQAYCMDQHVTKGACVKIVEVLVDGWPYAFVVATRPIKWGEELTVDHGESYWATQRALLARLLEMGLLGQEVIVGVDHTAAPEPDAGSTDPGLDWAALQQRWRPIQHLGS